MTGVDGLEELKEVSAFIFCPGLFEITMNVMIIRCSENLHAAFLDQGDRVGGDVAGLGLVRSRHSSWPVRFRYYP